MKTEQVSPNSSAQRVADDNKQSVDETLAQVDHGPRSLDTGAYNEAKTPETNNDQTDSTTSNIDTKPLIPTTPTPTPTPNAPTTTTTARITRSTPNRSSVTRTPKTPLFKTLTPIQKSTRKRKLSTIKYKLKQKSVNELTGLYNSTTDTDFKTLMTEVYHENCMDRLEEWEEKL